MLSSGVGAQGPAPADYTELATHGNFVVRDFEFHTGERLPELPQHYVTWGTPKKNTAGDMRMSARRALSGLRS